MELVEKLKAHWFLIVAFASITAAWGADHQKLSEMEKVVQKQSEMSKDITSLKEDSARVDERTKMIIQMMEEQNKLSRKMMRSQQSIEKKVSQ